GKEVRMKVSEKNMTDEEAMAPGLLEVRGNVPLRIDDGGNMRRLIADEIRRVCQTIEIELSENHWMLLRLFNGGADQIAPFGPRSVVVLHVLIAQQVLQNEPRMTGAFSNPAVGNPRMVARHAGAVVDLHQLVVALEAPILVARLRPGNTPGAGNVAAALAGFGKSRRGQDLAGELLRASHVDEHRTVAPQNVLHVWQKCAQREVRVVRDVPLGFWARLVCGHRSGFCEPLLAGAVYNSQVRGA